MVWFLLALLLSVSLDAVERIKSFHSDITIHPDSTMTVKETITVKAEGNQIRRGIFRTFPTRYKDRWGNNYVVGLNVKYVLHKGQKEPFTVESFQNGKRISIGPDDAYLSHGDHTYTIEYDTNRQLGFFDKHDELYWNVNGNGWPFAADEVSAKVNLPAGIDPKRVELEGYTGYSGKKGKDYQAKLISENPPVAYFQTSRSLRPNEGLTIVTSFNKGVITPPSLIQNWKWYLADNLHLIIFFSGLFGLLAFALWAWRRVRRTQKISTVIPLFYPPKNMSPGLVRYIWNMGYDGKVLAADIVNMGVKGVLAIDRKKGFLSWYYILQAKQKPLDDSEYAILYSRLFLNKDSIEISQKNRSTLDAVIKQLDKQYGKRSASYFENHGWYSFVNIMIGIVTLLAMMSVSDAGTGYLTVWAGFLFLLIIGLFVWLYKGFTPQGLAIKKEIDGFRMYLATTEEDRLKVIGTPPTKTPELYETFLPYAIALGVERQWSAQFAPLFEKMAEEGTPFVLGWYADRSFHEFNPGRFSSDLSNSISSSIAASSSPPGTSSGRGGGGFSGGGGGGGGGGGR